MSYINIHTHTTETNPSIWSMLNVHDDYLRPISSPVSCGMHPWYIREESAMKEFDNLRQSAANTAVCAIGECGLDKECSTDWELQKHWFEKQIVLANELRKPIIIHCVRAYDEVIAVLQSLKNEVPFVFHGFNRKQELATQLISHGAYLSFGKALEKSQIKEALIVTPLTRIFFESDDANISIETIYKTAAEVLQLSVSDLMDQVVHNTNLVFQTNLTR